MLTEILWPIVPVPSCNVMSLSCILTCGMILKGTPGLVQKKNLKAVNLGDVGKSILSPSSIPPQRVARGVSIICKAFAKTQGINLNNALLLFTPSNPQSFNIWEEQK